MSSLARVFIALGLLVASCASSPGSIHDGEDSWLAHDVYFKLNDPSPQACDEFVAACWSLLAEIEGVRFFASGTRAEEFDRGVNDTAYDVSLHVFFVNRDAYDAYLTNARHVELLEQYAETWTSVRVFDSFVEARTF